MKNVIFGIFSVLIAIVLIQIAFTLHGRSIRETELNNALDSSMEKAMDMLTADRSIAPRSEDEWLAMFMETLLLQIDSKSNLTVNILDADMEKGLLSVEAILTFKHPIGTTGSVHSHKTVLLEQYQSVENPTMYTITFLVEGERYKVFSLPAGSSYIQPAAPTIVGKVFLGWKKADSNDLVDLSTMSVAADEVYYAVFE